MLTNLNSIVYASSATKLFTNNELIDLLKISQENNRRHEITGLLLYKGGNFLQAIEGPVEATTQLFDKILQDPRHQNVMLLTKEGITKRQFPDWSMGFHNLDTASKKELEGYSQFLDHDFTPEYFHNNLNRAYVLLLNFKQYIR